MGNRESHCRSCGSERLQPVLDLGETPLANALLTDAEVGGRERTYPLELVLCEECSLVQITETVPPEQLFSDYLYLSSFSETMLLHSKTLVQRMIRERGIGPGSLAAEIASNDGYLLQYYDRAGIPVLGIEPAANIAKIAEDRGITTRVEFFGEEAGIRLATEGIAADVIHANNVLAHVADLNGVVEGLRLFLNPEGVAVIEVPYVRDMIEGLEFDTIYHEHLCYFSLSALHRLFRRHGLEAARVERLPIHGGSLRIFVQRDGSSWPVEGSVAQLLEEEAGWGVDSSETYQSFALEVEQLKQDLCGMLTDLKSKGKRIAAYGASAKGSTLLNYFGIGEDTIDFVVDRSDLKQGKFTPGTHLPILPPEALLEHRPDHTLLLTWNFAEEILRQQAEYRNGGGQFIVPLPTPRIV